MTIKNKHFDATQSMEQSAYNDFYQNGFMMINKRLLQFFGGEVSCVLSNLLDKWAYFKSRGMLEDDGLFFLLETEQCCDVGATAHSLRKSLNILRKLQFIKTERKGVPAKTYYWINFKLIKEFREIPLETCTETQLNSVIEITNNWLSEILITCSTNFRNQVLGNFELYIRRLNIRRLKERKPNLLLPTEVGRGRGLNQSLTIGENTISNPPIEEPIPKPIPEKKPRKKQATIKDKVNNSHRMLARRLLKAAINADSVTTPGGMAKHRPEEDRKKRAKKLQSDWSLDFAKMEFHDGISIEELKKAMDWYEENIEWDSTPVIASGGAFRKKYENVCNGMVRYKKKQAPKMSPANNAKCLREQKPRNLKYGYVDENGDCFDERGRKI